MSKIHCGVFPARAEGWNLEALELLASGRHLIITNCTGHTEFCNKENSRLIEMESGFEAAFDGKFFGGFGSWRSIKDNEIDQMVEHMREIHKLHQEGSLNINTAGIDSVKKFTWSNVTDILDDKLKTVIS
jgi:glycosyltransferase involved in cell wall biosynthesis